MNRYVTMRRHHPNLRFRILILSGFTLSLIFLTLGFMLRLSWIDCLETRKREAAREAVSASILLRGAMVDASRILDVAKNSLESTLGNGPMDRKQTHEILRSAVQNFSIHDTRDTSGLLLFVDATGRLIARSWEYPTQDLDFSNRNYYLDLRDNPSREFSIGRLRKAVNTDRLVFHLGMPVHRLEGSFGGVVAVQLDVSELAATLGGMLSTGKESHLCILCPDGRPLFVYPPRDNTLPMEEAIARTLLLVSAGPSGPRKTAVIRGGAEGFPGNSYVSFERDPLFGTMTCTYFPKAQVLALFLRGNLPLILFSAIAVLGITCLFAGLYRQARRLELALHQATTDPATGIPNRRALEIRTATLWEEAVRRGRPVTALFLDIDRFKEFNDIWGHHAGDRVIKLMAGLLRKCTDRPFDFFCRWGGEEFLILLPETGTKGALAIAERITGALRGIRLGHDRGKLPQVTISVGIASTEHAPADSIRELIHRADLKMLEAKSTGRNRILAEG